MTKKKKPRTLEYIPGDPVSIATARVVEAAYTLRSRRHWRSRGTVRFAELDAALDALCAADFDSVLPRPEKKP